MSWLGVDMGGTATRWVLCNGPGAVLARGKTSGASGMVFDPAERAAFDAALTGIRAATGPLFGAYLGVTGAGFAKDPALLHAAAQALGLTPDRVRVVNDMVLAWHAVWPQGGGHVVTAGTGSVGFSLAGGTTTLVGGRGMLLDDAGSGAWIGLQAVRALWRLVEDYGKPQGAETLARLVFDAMGGSDWEDTRRYIYGHHRGGIAALARPVAEAAAQGDPLALDLLTRAGDEIARLCRTIVTHAGPGPVAVFGGIIALHPSIRAAIEAGTPGLTLSFPHPDAALAAAALARSEIA